MEIDVATDYIGYAVDDAVGGNRGLREGVGGDNAEHGNNDAAADEILDGGLCVMRATLVLGCDQTECAKEDAADEYPGDPGWHLLR